MNTAENNPHIFSIAETNPLLSGIEYSMRGKIVTRMNELQAQMDADPTSLKFTKFCKTNTGNPQALGQKPITFFRQVLSAVLNPELLALNIYSEDVCARASEYLKAFKSVGAYTPSVGVTLIRENVAKFIAERDGIPSEASNIYLSNGGSESIVQIFTLLNECTGKTGFMLPIPQYPQYYARITLNNCKLVGYLLDEENDWQINFEHFRKQYDEATAAGTVIRALTLINPGNPTGAVFTKETIQNIIQFCYERRILIIADEVYQSNIYDENKKFVSVKKALYDMPDPTLRDKVTVVSLHSISKGFMGECGLRGGYIECINMDPGLHLNLKKLKGFVLCPNTVGQIGIDLLVRPPIRGVELDSTVDLFEKEKNGILASLKERAAKVTELLSEFDGVKANKISAALYAFPQLMLPKKFVEEAKTKGVTPDLHYCLTVLEECGMVCVPGNGFTQADGTYHFRTTILPLPIGYFLEAFEGLKEANNKIMREYKD